MNASKIANPGANLFHERLGLSKPRLRFGSLCYATSKDAKGQEVLASGNTLKTAYFNLGQSFGLAP